MASNSVRVSQAGPSASLGVHGTVLRGHKQRPLQVALSWYCKAQYKARYFYWCGGGHQYWESL